MEIEHTRPFDYGEHAEKTSVNAAYKSIEVALREGLEEAHISLDDLERILGRLTRLEASFQVPQQEEENIRSN